MDRGRVDYKRMSSVEDIVDLVLCVLGTGVVLVMVIWWAAL